MRNKVGRRKGEMWISNNKVLIGGGVKKPHARNPNFETEETKLLISLWGDPKVQKTLITTHKKHPVIAKLADKMREHGYHRSPEEINTRIKNLKCFYNRIKKDLENGIVNEPTWRHYGAMDEILTRPIFGNRVQQPHLQQSTTFQFTEEADGKELRPEDLLSIEGEFDENDVDFEDGSLIPKEEPIDIDDMDEVDPDDLERHGNENEIEDVNDIFPKLSAYLQLASNSALKGAPKEPADKAPPLLDIKQSPPSSPVPSTPSSPVVVTSAPASSAMAITSALTTTTTSKISLVPTNILMKPQTTQSSPVTSAQFSFKPQQFICAKSTSSTSTTGAGMPMKVLLVNTLSKPGAPATASGTRPTIVTASTSQASAVRPIVSIQPKTATSITVNSPAIQSAYRTRSTTAATANAQAARTPTVLSTNKYLCSGGNGVDAGIRRTVPMKAKGSPGFRTLLNQLVQMQTKQLEVSRQRLEMERERLDFEKNTGEKILSALTSLLAQKVEAKEEDKN